MPGDGRRNLYNFGRRYRISIRVLLNRYETKGSRKRYRKIAPNRPDRPLFGLLTNGRGFGYGRGSRYGRALELQKVAATSDSTETR